MQQAASQHGIFHGQDLAELKQLAAGVASGRLQADPHDFSIAKKALAEALQGGAYPAEAVQRIAHEYLITHNQDLAEMRELATLFFR